MSIERLIDAGAPQLIADKTGAFSLLEAQLISRQKEVENWFAAQWRMTPAPFYGSVDLRNAGFKLAPIDMNLFPAGFNNLNPAFQNIAAEAAASAIATLAPHAKNILLIPENHTRNLFYWENIRVLLKLLEMAGLAVRIGTLLPDYIEPGVITLNDGTQITLQTLTREQDQLRVGNFVPDAIILNNDLSDGIPEILKNLAQPVIPPAELGWSLRLKSGHFEYYAEVTEDFAQFADLDPWLLAPLFRQCGEVDFMQRTGGDCLTRNTHELFSAIRLKYAEHHIEHDPFVIMKADAGTYGMAVMTLRGVEALQSLNRKQRTGMAKTKSGQPVSQVILQEGVYTFETWGPEHAVAEPVVYMFGERVVGGFYRVHKARGRDENLNAPGMQFEPLPFVKPCHLNVARDVAGDCQNRFYIYGVIARLSMLAAAREMQEAARV